MKALVSDVEDFNDFKKLSQSEKLSQTFTFNFQFKLSEIRN